MSFDENGEEKEKEQGEEGGIIQRVAKSRWELGWEVGGVGIQRIGVGGENVMEWS